MAETCRSVISQWWTPDKIGEHAGLLRDRFLRVEVKDKKNLPEARKDLFDAMCKSLAQSKELYRIAYERQVSSFKIKNLESKGLFTTAGRMVIGLGEENVLETGLTLNHTYGTPMIPGTALKGLATHYSDHAWGDADDKFKLGGEYHRAIFGTTEDSGHIIFHDAWITPDSLEGSLKLDVMTPHHGDYYSAGRTPPTDFDDPKPVPFLSVVGIFHVAISCDVTGPEGQKWANLAFEMLSDALREWGIGGKTNAGYGRLINKESGKIIGINKPSTLGEEAEVIQINGMNLRDLAQESPNVLAGKWDAIEDLSLKNTMLEEIKRIYQEIGWWDNPPAKSSKKAIKQYKSWEEHR